MENNKTYYLFGESICVNYRDMTFSKLLKYIKKHDLGQTEFDIYEHDDSLQGPEDVLDAYDGYLGYVKIEKEEYDTLHNYMRPPVEMFEQVLPQTPKDIIFAALESLDANLNANLRAGIECDVDHMDNVRFDIQGLKQMMHKDYELKITMTQKQHDHFIHNDGNVDFPQYN